MLNHIAGQEIWYDLGCIEYAEEDTHITALSFVASTFWHVKAMTYPKCTSTNTQGKWSENAKEDDHFIAIYASGLPIFRAEWRQQKCSHPQWNHGTTNLHSSSSSNGCHYLNSKQRVERTGQIYNRYVYKTQIIKAKILHYLCRNILSCEKCWEHDEEAKTDKKHSVNVRKFFCFLRFFVDVKHTFYLIVWCSVVSRLIWLQFSFILYLNRCVFHYFFKIIWLK